MHRRCAACGSPLDALATRCRCGAETPEARDARSNPERPQCSLCGAPMELLRETCPSCGARAFPAMRPRRGRGSKGPPPEARGR